MDTFYVLAGPPGAGKTTLLSALPAHIACIGEPARRVLAQERNTGGRATGDQDSHLFVTRMLETAIDDYRQASGVSLFDRGLPDLLAFCRHYQRPAKDVAGAVARYRYAPKVFWLPAWQEIYTKDDDRTLDFEAARAFGNLIKTAYEESGYQLATVPKLAPLDRAAFVVNAIGT